MSMTARQRRRLHLALALVWTAQIPLALLVMPPNWQVPYLVFVSLYANVVGHWSAYSAETPVEHETTDPS